MFAITLQQKINRDVTVIIRAVGERTEKLCYELLAQQISSKNIFITHETPFPAALKKSFEIGINEDRRWTLVIDADVLVRTNILKDMYDRAGKAIPEVFVVQSDMLDKFFGGQRAGGVKIYRTNLLTKALELIDPKEQRPEGSTVKKMHKNGYYIDSTNIVCGIHDFEQYYSDIFRKGFQHAIKSNEFSQLLMTYWQRMGETDKDFLILLQGDILGRNHVGLMQLHKDEVKESFDRLMKELNLDEKAEIGENFYNSEQINDFLKSFVPPEEYSLVKEALEKRGRPTIPQK